KLTINVGEIKCERKQINNETKFPKLKHFSLTSFDMIHDYDKYIIPLLHRMINLEELILFLIAIRTDSTLVDGTELYDEVLVHMSQLNKFVFSINTNVFIENNEMDVPSNEEIQNSFIGRGYGQVGSCVHFEPRKPKNRVIDFEEAKAIVKSHIYSLPYQFESFLHLNNSFKGGMFPLVKTLTISNLEPQKKKQHSSTLISFPHLNLLNLVDAHDDYAQQFLVDANTHLPCLLDLCILYESLEIVTYNFTNDATRLYCSKLKGLHMDKPFMSRKILYQYEEKTSDNINNESISNGSNQITAETAQSSNIQMKAKYDDDDEIDNVDNDDDDAEEDSTDIYCERSGCACV
ncbi:unnamed protein product, partial [Adineta steineri]